MTSDSVDQSRPEGNQASPRLPLRGKVSHVTGRKALGAQRGLPAIDRLSFSLPDGTTQDFGPPDRGQTDAPKLLATILPASFLRQPGEIAMCPICLKGDPSEKEHVPQQDLGGARMTMTCHRCNSDLGSKVEAELQHWFDHALVDVAFDHDGDVLGRRRLPRMYYRESADGSIALIVDKEPAPEVKQIIASGNWRMHWREPDPRRYRLALLKFAYLAACLYLHRVPASADAHAIRADLLAARDTPMRSRPPESKAANRLKIYRSPVGAQGPPLALVVSHDAEDDNDPEFLISLAGAVFVSWPFTDPTPGTHSAAPGTVP